MKTIIRAKFQTAHPSLHSIPAYEGSQSVEGIARSLVVVSHYLATGEVRFRKPYQSGIQIEMEVPRKGSFEAIYSILYQPEALVFGGSIVGGITANIIYDFLKLILKKGVGEDSDINTDEVLEQDSERGGDIEALIDAITPSLSRGHSTIGKNVPGVFIIQGDNNIVNLNNKTKNYIDSEIKNNEIEIQDVSVASYNVNSKYGRAFFHDLKRTIPFILDKDADIGSGGVITSSLNKYAMGIPSDITIVFRRIIAMDGTTKRITVLEAKEIDIFS